MKLEQLDPHLSHGAGRRFLKRQTNRAERRDARKRLDDALTKRRYRGYWS
jgi:hypothetical protein